MLDPTTHHPGPAATATPLLQQIHDEWAARGWLISNLDAFRMEADGDGDGGDGGDGAGDGDGGTGDGDDDNLGDAGKAALDKERADRKAAQKAQRAADRRANDLQAELDALKAMGDKGGDDAKKLTDADLKKARDEAEADATAKANLRILRAEVKAAAAGILANPELAPRLVDLDDFEVDEDGDVDVAEIKRALKRLAKENPGLAAGTAGNGGHGSGDGGARNGGSDADVTPGVGRMRHAYSTTSSRK